MKIWTNFTSEFYENINSIEWALVHNLSIANGYGTKTNKSRDLCLFITNNYVIFVQLVLIITSIVYINVKSNIKVEVN